MPLCPFSVSFSLFVVCGHLGCLLTGRSECGECGVGAGDIVTGPSSQKQNFCSLRGGELSSRGIQ